MSLTSELKHPNSPTSIFMRTHFPNTRRVMSLCRKRMGQDFHTHYPMGQVPWPLIGTALDYRLRFYFPQIGHKGQVENLICYRGAAKACGGKIVYDEDGNTVDFIPPEKKLPGRVDTEVLFEFFSELKNVLERLCLAGQRLDKDDEEIFLRYCVVMAALDVFFRAGFDLNSILLNPEPKKTQSEILSVAEDNWIDDLRTLSWSFYDNFRSLWSQPATLNPTFEGSCFVGGADADLIIDGCLIDIKTTINPLRNSEWIYQLLGYVLLDWYDDNRIRKAAIYFSRQCYLMEWDLNELIAELTGRSCDLQEMRQQWHNAIAPTSMIYGMDN